MIQKPSVTRIVVVELGHRELKWTLHIFAEIVSPGGPIPPVAVTEQDVLTAVQGSSCVRRACKYRQSAGG